jgi:hypothetical protein
MHALVGNASLAREVGLQFPGGVSSTDDAISFAWG